MRTPYVAAGGFLTVAPGAPAPDVQLHFVIAPLEDHGRVAVKAHGFSCHVCVLRPESAGQVTLASADPRAAPLIDPAFLTDDRDKIGRSYVSTSVTNDHPQCRLLLEIKTSKTTHTK